MAYKELMPLSRGDYLSLVRQMEETPDPDTVYTETGRHPELAELLRQFGYLAVSRYEAYELGVKLLKITEDAQKDAYLHSLAKDYLALVDATSSGLYSTGATDHLNSERSVLHEQLLAAIGETRESEIDMVAVCEAMISL